MSMKQTGDKSRRSLLPAALALSVLVAAGGVTYWRVVGHGSKGQGTTPGKVTEQVVSNFFKGLAALDAGENELAARVIEETLALVPDEPALWANLSVARMRLGDLSAARESLDRAAALGGDDRQLLRLRAEVLEQSGEIDAAIEQLRQLHRVWPENLAVTFSLVRLLGQVRSDEAEQERLMLLSALFARDPGNLRVRCERARVAATLARDETLRSALAALRDDTPWPEAAEQQLSQADEATDAGDFRKAARALTFFENLLKRHPRYQQSLVRLGVSSLSGTGTPVASFLRHRLPAVEAAEADLQLTFEMEAASDADTRAHLVLGLEHSGERNATRLWLSDESLHMGESAPLPFPGRVQGVTADSVGVADLNADFQQDLILLGSAGCKVLLGQEEGTFAPQSMPLDAFGGPWQSVWTVDVEADGDLDLLLSDHQSALHRILNNGDMTFSQAAPFLSVEKVTALRAADFDGDGDVDLATLDSRGSLALWRNDRAGTYVESHLPVDEARIGMAIGDVDRDGRIDLVSLSRSGALRSAACGEDGSWSESPLTAWTSVAIPPDLIPGQVFLSVADLDNNGGTDILVSMADQTRIWLRDADGGWKALADTPAIHVTSVADMNGDGLLDLLGPSEGGRQVALNRSQVGYGWHVVRPTANRTAGDRRINSFGIGGRIEIRAGNLIQAATIDSPRMHFGLGRHRQADIARIVWPNGTVQAEFDLQSGQALIAEQRLKGSCPWVFAFDGQAFRFVKDFLWRSPLGLRINAQATAGVVQTEDWIKIAGRHLAPVKGRYALRITAELWETHFFDHVSLLAVDHPAGVEVLVDERFVPNAAPIQRVIVASPRRPLLHPVDHRGKRLDETLAAVDGLYADTFALGTYQGLAEDHWVTFEVPADVPADRPLLIVGNGWIYPTDSSLNVALAQGGGPRPYGLTLERQDDAGAWELVQDNLGFPAGKNKDVVVQLPVGSFTTTRRFRLRTNLEIYWDALGWSQAVEEVEPSLRRLPLELAQLRQRGFSKLLPVDRRRPDTPRYDVEATGQRWLDLEGYYTRFGDVQALLASVDDRYVIMNAGDELLFEFADVAEIPRGWRRDFVLVGDGWVKDGDFNTAFSRWVRPLPSHEDLEYAGPLQTLEEDPVYARHPEDWRLYHTRYVTPRSFQKRVWSTFTHATLGEDGR